MKLTIELNNVVLSQPWTARITEIESATWGLKGRQMLKDERTKIRDVVGQDALLRMWESQSVKRLEDFEEYELKDEGTRVDDPQINLVYAIFKGGKELNEKELGEAEKVLGGQLQEQWNEDLENRRHG